VNPVQPNLQLTGVFNLKIARLYKDILTGSRKSFSVVHSIDGYDEVSLTAPVKIFSDSSEQLLYPEELSDTTVNENDLFGGFDIQESERIFKQIVSGKGTVIQNEVIKINTALGIKCFKPEISIKEAQLEAEQILMSGKVIETVESVIKISQK